MRLVILTKKGDGRAVYVNRDKVVAVHTLDGATFIEIDSSHYTSFVVEEPEEEVARLLIEDRKGHETTRDALSHIADLERLRRQLADVQAYKDLYIRAVDAAIPILQPGGRYAHLLAPGDGIIEKGPAVLAKALDEATARLVEMYEKTIPEEIAKGTADARAELVVARAEYRRQLAQSVQETSDARALLAKVVEAFRGRGFHAPGECTHGLTHWCGDHCLYDEYALALARPCPNNFAHDGPCDCKVHEEGRREP
jgi:hypothetical protein